MCFGMTSANRLMDILELLARQSAPLDAATISRLCGIPRSSTYNLLKAMGQRGYVTVNADHGWSIGPQIGELGAEAASLGEALAVLEAFDGAVTHTETADIVRRTRMQVGQVQRALSLLGHHELLVAHWDGTYTLGMRALGLIREASSVERLRVAARPVLTELRDASGETANLLVRESSLAVYLEQEESQHALRHAHWIGRRIPLEGSASGKALSGAAGVQVARDAVEAGVTAVACAVPGHADPPAVISVTGPSSRLRGKALAKVNVLVAHAASRVSERLGLAG